MALLMETDAPMSGGTKHTDHIKVAVLSGSLRDTLEASRQTQRWGWMAVTALTIAASATNEGALRVFGSLVGAETVQWVVLFFFLAYVLQMKYLLGRVEACLGLLSSVSDDEYRRAGLQIVSFPWLGSPAPPWVKDSRFPFYGSYIVYLLGWAAWVVPMNLWQPRDSSMLRFEEFMRGMFVLPAKLAGKELGPLSNSEHMYGNTGSMAALVSIYLAHLMHLRLRRTLYENRPSLDGRAPRRPLTAPVEFVVFMGALLVAGLLPPVESWL